MLAINANNHVQNMPQHQSAISQSLAQHLTVSVENFELRNNLPVKIAATVTRTCNALLTSPGHHIVCLLGANFCCSFAVLHHVCFTVSLINVNFCFSCQGFGSDHFWWKKNRKKTKPLPPEQAKYCKSVCKLRNSDMQFDWVKWLSVRFFSFFKIDTGPEIYGFRLEAKAIGEITTSTSLVIA